MDERTLTQALRAYIVDEILEGDGAGFDAQTPLLEWGLLNSMELARLLAFVRARFGVTPPADEITPANFRNLECVVRMVNRHAAPQEMA
jgi:acyl carrier protein